MRCPSPPSVTPALEELDRLSAPARERLNQYRVPATSSDQQAGREEESGASATEQQSGGVLLTTDEQDYMRAIHEQPFLNLGQLSNHVGFTKTTTKAVRTALKRKGLIEEFPLTLGDAVGGYATYTVLTEQGYNSIGQTPPAPFKGRRGAAHRFLQHFCHGYLAGKGFTAEIEMNLNGKRADIGYDDSGKLIALEVAAREDNEVINVKRDLQAGFDRVVTLCSTKTLFNTVKRDFKKFLSDQELDRVQIVLLADSEFTKALIG